MTPGSGAPLLRVKWLDCLVYRVIDVLDQVLVVGLVHHAGTGPDAAPLVRFDGDSHRLPETPAAACGPPLGGGGDWS